MTLEVGSPVGPLRIDSVNPERMKTLAALLQDPNPIHIHAEAVQALGMGDRVVNQGPGNMGFLTRLLLEAAPGATIARLNVRFMANVFGGDAVVASGEVTAVETDDAGRTVVTCDVALDVEGGARALQGIAVLRLAS